MSDSARITRALDDLHKSLRDDASIGPMHSARVTLKTFEAAGVIDAQERRLRTLALQSCPGHDDEGGRTWCAYCGDLKGTTS